MGWCTEVASKKKQPGDTALPLYPNRPGPEERLFRCCLAETVAELFHASAHVVHRLLRAGIEGV